MNQLIGLTALKLFCLVILMTLLQSCLTTKTTVGQYVEESGEEYTFDKGKQVWIFWGFIPLGRRDVNTPTDGNCEVITRHNLGDAIISALTGGILTTHTIKVKAKRDSEPK